MKQILAIFSKDSRRFWPEIAVSLAITAAFVLDYPTQWRVNNLFLGTVSYSFHGLFTSGAASGFLAGCLIVLVPVSWWILIARLVHGERLVGHTQFWLTRPYDWRRFLVAKLLFLAAFLYLPFLAAQMALLAQAGFDPFAYIPGLLYNLVSVTGILVLPLLALSVVTSGFGRMTLVLLGLILFILATSALLSLRPGDVIGGIPSPVAGNLASLVLVVGAAAAVLVQYARRRLRTAWLAIAGIAVALILLNLIDPDQSLLGRSYAADHDPPPIQFVYAAEGLRQPLTNGTTDKREYEIVIPIRASGVAQNAAAAPVALKVFMDGPGGQHWESPWQGALIDRFLPGSTDSAARFRMRRSVYDQLKSSPLTVRLAFAVDKAVLVNYTTVPLPLTSFSIADLGICAPQVLWFENPPEIRAINCRSAMHRPDLTFVTAHWTEGRCPSDSTNSPFIIGTAWLGSLDPDPADFGITSVWNSPLNLSNEWFYQHPLMHPRQLCPGSPITFARFRRTGKSQVTLTIPNFRLPDLALGDQYLKRYGG